MKRLLLILAAVFMIGTYAYADSIIVLSGAAGNVVDNNVNDFRLTLTTGVPVTTADVTGATTIYLTPYRGNRIALYNGTSWQIDISSEVSLALGTLTAARPYDIFCYDNSGTPTLEFLAWTSTTARATALAYQDGILVKTGAATRRYLGTFYTSSTTATADSSATRYLANYYNQVDRPMSGTFSADRTTTGTSYGEVNAEIQIKFVVGVSEFPVLFYCNGTAGGVGNPTTAIGIDSTSVAAAGFEASGVSSTVGNSVGISGSTLLAAGYHYATILCGMSGGTGTYYYQTYVGGGVSKFYLLASKKG